MSINLGIIDQRVRKLSEDLAGEFDARLNIRNDDDKRRSTTFVFLVVKTTLDLSDDETLDCLTEGGHDFGVDAIHAGDVEDGEFLVTLFQGKYKRDLNGVSTFPQNGVEKLIQAVRYLFDPDATISTNPQLTQRIEEVRSLIRDGHIPRVRAVLCNNGLMWNDVVQGLIDQSGFPPDQVSWEYVNHDDVVRLLLAPKQVDDTLRLSGKAIVEDFDYCRVLVGKIPVHEVAGLFDRHGDLLLERNVRRYLGVSSNRVNLAINRTLLNPRERGNFYFYNNGITLVCHHFTYNALQADNYLVRVEGMQVINGGQTCKTIQQSLTWLTKGTQANTDLEKTYVLVRLYELPTESADLVRSITYATNSQNPVDLRDLKANDERQVGLEAAVAELGYTYRRHRSGASLKSTEISSATVAEAVLSVWRRRPHQAKYQSREHFGKLYDLIFTDDLNGAQVVIATLLFRIAENKRRRPPPNAPEFVAYASCFIAMLMGRHLLAELGIAQKDLNHLKFAQAKTTLEKNEAAYFEKAVTEIAAAITKLYGGHPVSLQRLAATFRRGDLIQELS
ncbi:MAG: AIPR family protein [Planctomycetaceae bacterium]